MTNTRTTYIKPNSATHQSAQSFAQTVAETLYAAQISADERNEILFETGCEFVEHYIELKNKAWRDYLLTRADSGFWAWWMAEFAKDDEALICWRPEIFNEFSYVEIKRGMLQDGSIYDAFTAFIYSKTKRIYDETKIEK